MTVIRKKQSYNYPKPNSVANSDTESLHLGSAPASDTESINGEPYSPNRITVFRAPTVKIAHIEDLINIKKSSGKKKMRRYENRCSLQTLNEEDENENIIVIMESYKSPLTRLLEDKEAMAYWNDFIEKSEEEQNKIVKEFSDRYYNQESRDNSNKPEKPGKISSRIRRTLKIRKNLSLEIVKMCEEDLIEFFKITPGAIYIKFPPTSFDRVLLHAIAQYHKLESINVSVEDGNRRCVEVFNNIDNWVPAEDFLTEFIKKLRT